MIINNKMSKVKIDIVIRAPSDLKIWKSFQRFGRQIHLCLSVVKAFQNSLHSKLVPSKQYRTKSITEADDKIYLI